MPSECMNMTDIVVSLPGVLEPSVSARHTHVVHLYVPSVVHLYSAYFSSLEHEELGFLPRSG